MPGRESLARQRYYAHPRNAFWPIISRLFELTAEDYEPRAQQLTRKGVAVWDVLKACCRSGSLDSAIDDRTIVANDFSGFYTRHTAICRVFFNGAKAESVYLKHVLPDLAEPAASLKLLRLPSTSPAHAGMNLDEKTRAWRAVIGLGLE
jgi:hypoxanthine-DNA glycosylase